VMSMVIGVCRIDLWLMESNSLKYKRRTVRSIIDQLKARYNVSVAEVDHHELWQRTSIGIACIGNQKYYVEEVLQTIVRSVANNASTEITNCTIDFL
jgi:uncharacterized protein YlxP (DUF503 family)